MTGSENIVCIYKTHDSAEADLVKAQLEGEGIPCFLKSDNAGGMLPHLTTMAGIEIMVRQEDKAQAAQVIYERHENNNDH